MSITIRIVASPEFRPNEGKFPAASEHLVRSVVETCNAHNWPIEQISVDGQLRVDPYGPQDVLIENGMPVMDDDARPSRLSLWLNEKTQPSPLWYWLGIPACVLSIAAGVWLLAREADRRMEARQPPRVIFIDPHHAQEAAK